MKRKIFGILVLGFVFLPLLAVQIQAQTTSGRIAFSGTAPGLSGPLDLTFILYDADTGGSALYMDSQTGVDVSTQPFTAVLGAGTGGDVPAGIFAALPSVFIAIEETLNPGAEIAPRVPINSSGYARNAATLGNSVFTDASGNVGIGTTTPNGRLEVVGNDASVVIGDPNCGPGSNTVAIGFVTGAGLNCGDNFNFGASTTLKETVINRPSGGQISFREGNGPDQMRIAPGGNVSIGGNVAIGKGVNNNGGGFKHMRASQNLGPGQTRSAIFNWPTPFSDINYTLIATVEQTATGGAVPTGCKVVHVVLQTDRSVSVKVTNDDTVSRTCILHLAGIHD